MESNKVYERAVVVVINLSIWNNYFHLLEKIEVV